MGMLYGRSGGDGTGRVRMELLMLTELTSVVVEGWRGTCGEGVGTGLLAGAGGGPSTAAQSCGGGCGGGGLLGTTPESRLGAGCGCWVGTGEKGRVEQVMVRERGCRMRWGLGTHLRTGAGGGRSCDCWRGRLSGVGGVGRRPRTGAGGGCGCGSLL